MRCYVDDCDNNNPSLHVCSKSEAEAILCEARISTRQQRPLYECDPEKNTDCVKNGCISHNGPCHQTFNKEFAREPVGGNSAKPILPDSGKRLLLYTGAMREPATGKGRFDLISPIMLMRLAKHYENGAQKYAVRNWEKGIPASRCFDSAMRHLTRYLAGDNEEDHLSAAIWNIACIVHFEEVLPEMIDIPTRPNYYKKDAEGEK